MNTLRLEKISDYAKISAGIAIVVGLAGSALNAYRGYVKSVESTKFCQVMAEGIQKGTINSKCLIKKVNDEGFGEFGISLSDQYANTCSNQQIAEMIYQATLGNKFIHPTFFENIAYGLNYVTLGAIPEHGEYWAKELVFSSKTRSTLSIMMNECKK